MVYRKQNGEKQYYLTNAHGDVDMLADGAGNVIKTYTYDAFGVETNKDEADANPFRYAGEYYDGETDSIYLRARYYAPRTGRFTTEDPIRDGLNWYSYCGGNPVMRVDPSGMSGETIYINMGNNNIAKISNVEQQETGLYGSLRDMVNMMGDSASLDYEEVGNGARVTFRFNAKGIDYRLEIGFDDRKSETYASSIKIFYNDLEITNSKTTDKLVKSQLKEQMATFYLKKDDNSNNLVVQAKITTTFLITNRKSLPFQFTGAYELAKKLQEGNNYSHTLQFYLDYLKEQPLLQINFGDLDKVATEINKQVFK